MGWFVDVTDAVGATSYTPLRASVVGVNLGVLVLWTTAIPALSNVAGMLYTVGFALVAVLWAAFVVRLWQTLIGDDPRPRHGEQTDVDASVGD